MTAKNIIDQIEKMFGRQPEQYMFQLINDALDEIKDPSFEKKDIAKVNVEKETNNKLSENPEIKTSKVIKTSEKEEKESKKSKGSK